MNYTENYQLRLPESNDNYTVEDSNQNAQIIDEELKKRAILDENGMVESSQLPEMNFDPAGSASAVQTNLNSHIGNKNNPHSVTAAQVGALPIAGGTMNGQIIMNGNRISDLPVPASADDPIRKGDVWSTQTASMYNLGSGSVPDAALQILAKAALYKTISSVTGLYDISGNLLLQLPGVRIETGSYVGTNTSGKNNPNSISINPNAKLCIITGGQLALGQYNRFTAIFFPAFLPATFNTGTAPTGYVYLQEGNNVLTDNNALFNSGVLQWYADNATFQLNVSNYTYKYVVVS